MNTLKIVTTQNIELEYDLASLGERIAGYIIDSLILIAYLVIILFIFIGGDLIRWSDSLIFLFIIPVFFYHLVSEILMNGQTVGKKVMNIKIISLDGRPATIGQYLIRWLFRFVDFTITNCLGALICVAVSEKRQRIGDIVAGTAMIKTVPRTAFQQTLYTPVQPVDYTVSFPEVTQLGDKDMQLIKEVIMSVQKTGNHALALQAANKIMETLHIQSAMEPLHFLQTVLADYNYLTSVDNDA